MMDWTLLYFHFGFILIFSFYFEFSLFFIYFGLRQKNRHQKNRHDVTVISSCNIEKIKEGSGTDDVIWYGNNMLVLWKAYVL